VLTLLASSADGPTLWTFFGRFHPATVHFPVAMLAGAALMEFLQIVRRKPGLSPATFAMTAIGLASCALATLMGWALASSKPPKELMETHRWAGVWTLLVAIGALAMVFNARASQGWIVQAARGSLFLGMIMVSITGHWGGQLSFGETYYSDAWPWRKNSPEDNGVRQLPRDAKVDFVADIAPIIRDSCFLCHGGEKSGKNGKGGLKLTTKALAMKGGDGGRCIVPHKPEDSTFYTLLITDNVNDRMPEKAPQLPREKIDKIRRWIQQGAVWPDGVEIKKP